MIVFLTRYTDFLFDFPIRHLYFVQNDIRNNLSRIQFIIIHVVSFRNSDKSSMHVRIRISVCLPDDLRVFLDHTHTHITPSVLCIPFSVRSRAKNLFHSIVLFGKKIYVFLFEITIKTIQLNATVYQKYKLTIINNNIKLVHMNILNVNNNNNNAYGEYEKLWDIAFFSAI